MTTAVEAACWTTAQHEVLHSLYATSCGWSVELVRCHPHGQSHLRWPFAVRDLCPRYRAHPLQTLAQLRQIAGMLLSPYIVVDCPPRGVHPMEAAVGRDRDHLERWGAAWECYRWLSDPPEASWRSLCIDAKYRVLGWAGDPGRKGVIDHLVHDLLEHGILGGSRWHNLVREHTPAWLKKKDKEHYAALL
jgi:hypothetical protein